MLLEWWLGLHTINCCVCEMMLHPLNRSQFRTGGLCLQRDTHGQPFKGVICKNDAWRGQCITRLTSNCCRCCHTTTEVNNTDQLLTVQSSSSSDINKDGWHISTSPTVIASWIKASCYCPVIWNRSLASSAEVYTPSKICKQSEAVRISTSCSRSCVTATHSRCGALGSLWIPHFMKENGVFG